MRARPTIEDQAQASELGMAMEDYMEMRAEIEREMGSGAAVGPRAARR